MLRINIDIKKMENEVEAFIFNKSLDARNVYIQWLIYKESNQVK